MPARFPYNILGEAERLAGHLRVMLLERLDLQAGIQSFTDQDEPAYRQWMESNVGALRRRHEEFEYDVEDLTGAVEEIKRRLGLGFAGEAHQSPAEIVAEVMSQVEADREARAKFLAETRRATSDAARQERYQRQHENADGDPDSDTSTPADENAGSGLVSAMASLARTSDEGEQILSDELIDMMFREFMDVLRGIDIDLMDGDEYRRARREFVDSFRHARDGDMKQFEKSIRLAGADDSADNKRAVKSAFRRLAKRLHPDHNPDLEDDENAKRLWREAGVASQSLDLPGLERIELQCILHSGEKIEDALLPQLLELREWLEVRIDDLGQYFDHIATEPAFGFATSPPPGPAVVRELREDFAFKIAALNSERGFLRAEVERLRAEPVRGGFSKTQQKPPATRTPAKPQTRKRTGGRKTARTKSDQMEFGY